MPPQFEGETTLDYTKVSYPPTGIATIIVMTMLGWINDISESNGS
ncbi:hypothetical protein DLJ82_1815 [Rhizobium leguminosarum]|uniref:Uncharacterized protein n=1 Tax=Rhizobium leguminosarum TaxID=384 RepID=A0A2Z4YDT0_RHILE|nr:hypothetical protein DLJ82_1815 [Rhizobium leguminosarum]